MSQIYNIYNNLNVVGSSQSFTLSSTSVTGLTLYGNIDAKYIGTGLTGTIPNIVTNTEFTYLSGLTGYVQTQINDKVPKDAPLIVFSGSNNLTNSKILSAGTNVVITSSQTQFGVSARIGSLDVGVISITTSGNSQYSLDDLYPTGWDGSYPNRSTQIRITPLNVIKISGLSGGTSGRVATITNTGNFLIILENNGAQSLSSNQFQFAKNKAWFLVPKASINLIYDSVIQKWRQMSNSNNYGFDIYDEMYCGSGNQTGQISTIVNTPYNTGLFILSGNNGTTSASNGMSYNGNGGPTGAIRIQASQGSSVGNRDSRVRVGLNEYSNYFESNSGTSILFVTQLAFRNSNFLPTNNRATTIGTENNYLRQAYTATTSNNTTPPQLSGGSYWLFDVSGSSNVRYVVQNTANTTTISSTTFSLSSLGESAYNTFGIYSIATSGASIGSTSFFYLSATTTTYTILPPVTHNGVIQGYPGINYYSGYNYVGASSPEAVSQIYIDNIGFSYIDLT